MTAKKHSAAASLQQQPLLADDLLAPQPQSTQYVVVLPQYPPPNRPRLLRNACRRCIFCLAIFLLFLVAAAYLLWPSDPGLSVVRFRLDRLKFHTSPAVSLDATLDLTVKIQNRDMYSLDYDSLVVAIGYRGKQLGYVTSDRGSVKARETTYVNATLRLDGVEILTDVVLLLEDLARGAVVFDTTSDISGRLGVFFFDLPLELQVADCSMLTIFLGGGSEIVYGIWEQIESTTEFEYQKQMGKPFLGILGLKNVQHNGIGNSWLFL
ncbi:hypothetical protein SASPL_110165 [Salvia splendens]|uniref:Late embryogenesis abundant protein LEA-2 subgroup domain-containing protein n=1 Tax=Salvia splendens TaxID=180675 RepID=A0A8X9A3Y7_SALSN|nr:hypothetical protein SASPL_110165 [Salvia splendens]